MTPIPLIDLLVPVTCAACGLPGAHLCAECEGLLVSAGTTVGCRRCGHPWSVAVATCPECPRAIDRLRYGVAYQPPATAVVHAFKHGRRRGLAHLLAGIMVAAMPRPGADALVPVPITPRRRRQRGANQSVLLAHALARHWDLPVAMLLRRVGPEVTQRGASATRRADQVRGVFVARRDLPGARVVLVDDVMTTGATLSACARALRRAGAVRVEAVAAARVIRFGSIAVRGDDR